MQVGAGIRFGVTVRRVALVLLAAGLVAMSVFTPVLITAVSPGVSRQEPAARVLIARAEVATAQPADQTRSVAGYR